MRFILDRFLLLPIGAAIAVVWANTLGESYFRFAHALAFPVNEIGMALFLGLIAQETLDALLPGGALHRLRNWSVPVIAAFGGIAGAVLVYVLYVQLAHEVVLMGAWPVVCAIDMAAGYFVLKMLMPRSGSIPFLLVLAVTTNVVGLAVVGLRPGMIDVHPAGPVLLAGGIAIAAVLRLLRIRAYWGYVAIAGTVSWIGLYFSGLHPALALIPIVPFLPHEPRREPFADVRPDDDVHRFEHQWNGLVQAILFFFGLVNAGVILTAYDTGTWALLLAALAGRPIGILAAVGLAHNLGLRLPGRMTWRHLVIVALATSSGFTFALFFASAALPAGAVLAQIKVGALGTAAGAVLAIVAARVLLPRLRPYAPPRPRAFASSHRY